MAERVLLTGATGFVGRAVIAPLLARGFAVHAVSRTPPPNPPPHGGGGLGSLPRFAGEGRSGGRAPSLTHHAADLLDTAATRALLRDIRPTHLLHCAWYVEHQKFWTAPENADWLEASDALAAAFAEAGGRRFIGVGTCAEYADEAGEDDLPWPESRPIALATPYGRAKAALAARLAQRPDTAWARLFHLFGPGEHPDRLVPSVIAALRQGREARCASGRPVRDFAGTGFVGRALAALTASAVTGPVNIASGEGRAIADVVRLLGQAAGRPDLIRVGALPDRPGEVPVMVADVTRLRTEVGFKDLPDVEKDLRGMVGAAGIEPATLRV